MSGNLIDTNIIIKLLNGDVEVARIFEDLEDVHIPVVAVGELTYGANKSSKRDSNLKLFTEFVGEYPVLGINTKVADAYGKVKFDLVKQGINIPENDIWIAAIAISGELRVITTDKHFANIPGLKCEIII